ncbi:MAG: inorganic phosphate transporter [Gammaproteobacteria bacterium RIFCSPLOWO2_02_FULL_56_15]|nr:MAG: inorganic phosphate transporter [Gammaproteobacteria bacterium RIFCSPLOWO2_02_FULL_56_15]
MEQQILVFVVLAIVFGLYMAWGIGANDVANAMGTSVGSGALTLKRAVIIAAVLEFSGAFLAGSHVSETVRNGIVDPSVFAGDGASFMTGMLATLLGAGIWLQLASWKGWPVSTTHSIVGALVGFGATYGGIGAVHWSEVSTIAVSWVVSPLLSGIISYLIFRFLLQTIFYNARPLRAAKRLAPLLVFLVFFILTLTMVFKGLKNLNLDLSLPDAFAVASAIGLAASIISLWLVSFVRVDPAPPAAETADLVTNPRLVKALEKATKQLERAKLAAPVRLKDDASDALEDVRRLRYEAQRHYSFHTDSSDLQKVEKLFVYLQILSACFVAFAHGSNDVSNAIGPMSAVISVAMAGGESIAAETPVPLWVLGLGGLGIIVGLATWGWRVIETVGRRITELTPTRGFCAEFGAATTIVLATKLGLPISTTHTLVGAVLGVGLARGIGAVNLVTVRDIVLSWLITLPAGAALAILCYYGLDLLI